MKKFLFLIFLFSLLNSQEIKISFIDMERILKEYEGVKEAQEEVNKLVKGWEDELLKKKKEIDSLRNLYEKERPSLSEEARIKREREIKIKEEEYKKFLEEVWGKNGKLKEATKRILEPHVSKIQKTIEKIAKDMGYDLVIDISKDVILYSSQKVDITDLVLEELNREYKGTIGGGVLRKIKVGVFPFLEKSEALRASGLGKIFLSSLKSGLSKYTRLELIPDVMILSAMQRRNIDETRIEISHVKQMILELVADYAVFGRLEMEGGEIKIYADLIDSYGNIIESYTDSSQNEENPLKEAAYRIAQRIIERLKK
jgi:outer membrane protein